MVSPGRGKISSINSAAPSTEPHSDYPAGDRPRRQIYGRQTGPRLRAERKVALAEGLVDFGFQLPASGSLDPRSLFADPPGRLWLEIGFGGGEHLLARAFENPDVGFIGVEPFIAGVAQLLAGCRRQGVANVRVLIDDARLLLEALPDASIDRAFVLFPDPWPKLRHHKRRIVNRATLAALARVIRPEGILQLATDDPAYARWMLEALLETAAFDWQAERSADWLELPAGMVLTRYARKALAAGRRPVYLKANREPDEQAPSPLRDRGF